MNNYKIENKIKEKLIEKYFVDKDQWKVNQTASITMINFEQNDTRIFIDMDGLTTIAINCVTYKFQGEKSKTFYNTVVNEYFERNILDKL